MINDNWKCEKFDNYGWRIVDGDGNDVCTISGFGGETKAHIIAVAPQMYTDLRTILAICVDDSSCISGRLSAILKICRKYEDEGKK